MRWKTRAFCAATNFKLPQCFIYKYLQIIQIPIANEAFQDTFGKATFVTLYFV